MPEETLWYHDRLEGGWYALSVFLALGHFVVPFFFLLPRATKRNADDPGPRRRSGCWSMHLLDVYWLVIPSVHGLGATPGIVDLAALLAVGGVFLGAFGWLMRTSPLVPLGDPRLAESMAFENV